MFTNFIRFARQLSQLTTKTLSDNDSLLVVTDKGVPKKVLASDFASSVSLIFAHVSFDGSSGNSFDGSTIAGHNIKSVTRSSEGVFVVEFTTPHGTGKYTAVGSAGLGNHTSSARAVSVDEYTTTSITIRVERTDTGSQQDEAYIAIMVLG
jgi:hypothetical protein